MIQLSSTLREIKMASKVKVLYQAVDGFAQRRTFYTLALAQRYAQERVGQFPDLCAMYAVSYDGVGTIRVEGATLEDLFPATAEVVAPPARRGITVYEDGSDDYTGEDDLTERAIENRNDEYAQRQTAIDAAYGM